MAVTNNLSSHPLMKHARSLEGDKSGIGVIAYLSRLSRDNLTRNRLRLAVESFSGAVRQYQGFHVVLSSGDLVLTFLGAKSEEIAPYLTRLRNLFGEDPLFKGGTSDQITSRIFTLYTLPLERRAYALAVSHLAQIPVLPSFDTEEPAKPVAAQAQANEPERTRFRTHCDMSKALDLFNAIDIGPLLRRQSICSLDEQGENPRPVFSEIYTSMSDLRRQLSEAGDILADRWLFQSFTQFVDLKVLTYLTERNPNQVSRSFSLNANISTLLSPEFRKLDRLIGDKDKKTVMFELQPSDIYNDMGGFLFARDMLRERDYKICIDGLTPLTLPYIDMTTLEAHFMKVFIPTDMESMDDETMTHLGEAVKLFSRRVILCRCGSKHMAVTSALWGIRIFQGAYVDGLLKPRHEKANQSV